MTQTLDRSHRLYRLFEMDDGTREWWTVNASNMPGEQLTDDDVVSLERWLDQQSWRDDFYVAFTAHRKATIYGPIS